MVQRNHLLIALVMVAVVVVTVAIVGLGNNSGSANQTGSANGGAALKEASIDIYPKEYNETKGYPTTIEIRAFAKGYSNLSYENVRLCVYDRDGSVLAAETVGPFRVPTTREYFYERYYVNLSLATRPKYITVDHPELRKDTRVVIQMYELKYEGSDLDEWWSPITDPEGTLATKFDSITPFEFPRTNEVGKCG